MRNNNSTNGKIVNKVHKQIFTLTTHVQNLWRMTFNALEEIYSLLLWAHFLVHKIHLLKLNFILAGSEKQTEEIIYNKLFNECTY